MGSVQSCVLNLKQLLEANRIFLIGDDSTSISQLAQGLDCSAIVMTSEQEMQKLQNSDLYRAREKQIEVLLYRSVLDGIDYLVKIKDIMIAAYSSGVIASDDRILCVVYSKNKLVSITLFDANESIGGSLIMQVRDRVDYRAFEATLRIATELAQEGREKGPLGALFVLGDADSVIAHSKPLIINPFHGHDEISILSADNAETIKEFAQLDGAFIIDANGIVRASGRYIAVSNSYDLNLLPGLGGRHLAAASITTLTDSIAMTVSVSGIVRVFKKGEIIYKTEPIRLLTQQRS